MKAFGEAVGLLLAIVAIAWGTMIWFSEPERKPVVACSPLYWFSSGIQTTSAAAASTSASSTAPNSAHAPHVRDNATGRAMPVSDRVTLACLRFADRLWNR